MPKLNDSDSDVEPNLLPVESMVFSRIHDYGYLIVVVINFLNSREIFNCLICTTNRVFIKYSFGRKLVSK